MSQSDIQPEVPINERQIYDGRVIRLTVSEVRLPNGATSKRELVHHPGAVAIVAVDPDDQILLVRQYRFAAQRVLLEIPAGTLKPDEEPRLCAERELQEETGYYPGRLTSLGGFFVAPGYTTEFIHLFFAEDLSESRLDMDDDEFIAVDRLPLAAAITKIETGEIIDGKTIIGLLTFARLRGL